MKYSKSPLKHLQKCPFFTHICFLWQTIQIQSSVFKFAVKSLQALHTRKLHLMHAAPRFTMRPSSKLHREHLLLYVRVKSIWGRSNEPPLVIICLDVLVSCDLILRLRLKLSLCSSNRSNLYCFRGKRRCFVCVFFSQKVAKGFLEIVWCCLRIIDIVHFFFVYLEDQTYKKENGKKRKI